MKESNSLWRKVYHNQFIRFAVVGGLNTGTFYLLYLLFHQLFMLQYLVSHIAAFLLSMIGSYFLNVFFTFGVKPSWKTFIQFPLTQVVNFTVSTVFVFIFVEWVNLSPLIAPILAVLFTVPITFLVTAKILRRDGVSHES
ncbi:sugar translocase in surface polysaccharides biosynthesis [Bacillus sp. JCM 19045]|uniref:Flippase GtrA n=1 Tax=Shouchella xiaoxiensis TaxID=766895 RepID=A0ABS2T033_9BACI|nr:GtrA family protein [Shouchella xiaoxiensis]MBM7841142.1 putative flippase GtrA [Shouchella xiaoxiensis]GAF14774.1 sugar translocase in surface polysaccharides biosynthesis [Bacillus sp. JCM 19045]